ncbi:fasciclin-like arabinogalactan protein 19 [Quercus lobata]|uniref:FAS1 domain-containing protein n=1 Tax=Quercus lobata TaxID=97700 RepID=A0A7N2MX37_QUELO|nr:fasciclin-like arabinogalactan protein 19 [Quercus lobata]
MATKIVTLTLTLGVVILLLSLPGGVKPVHCISSGDMESMLSALRARGYNLFSNAIATSDLQLDLLCTHSNSNSNDNASNDNDDYFFTIFAPTDSALFALDMTQTAPFFTDTLRLHVVPKRLSFSQLQRLSSANLRTLLPSRDLHVTTRHLSPPPPPPRNHHNRRRRVVVVSVDEIEVVFPGVYYGRYVAVHGLNGILTLRGPPQYSSSSPVRSVLPQRTNICSNSNRTAPPPPQQPPQDFCGYSPANSPSYLGVSPGLAPTIQSPESENTASPSPSIGNYGQDDQDHQLGELYGPLDGEILEPSHVSGSELLFFESRT